MKSLLHTAFKTAFKSALAVTTTSLLFSTLACSQTDPDDDLLLFTIPAIAAANNDQKKLTGLDKINLLHGQWRFRTIDPNDGFIDEEFFRFNKNTATNTSNPSIFIIRGDSSLSNNFAFADINPWCEGDFFASYNTQTKTYLIPCNWGGSRSDLGSLYEFNTVAPSFSFRHYYYRPSTGELTTGLFDTGTATRISTSFSLTQGQSLNRPNTSQARTASDLKTMLFKRHQQQLQSVRARVLSPAARKTQQLLTQILNLQKNQ